MGGDSGKSFMHQGKWVEEELTTCLIKKGLNTAKVMGRAKR